MIELRVQVDTRAIIVDIATSDTSQSFTVTPAGIEINEALMNYLKAEHDLMVHRLTAERIVTTLGTTNPEIQKYTGFVTGRSLSDGTPKRIEISNEEIQLALAEIVDRLANAVALRIRSVMLEIRSDPLTDAQITLAGEFRYLCGLDRQLEKASGIEVVMEE